MPIIGLWCSITPKNLEATSITLFTGMINVFYNISNYFGSFILYILNMDEKNLSDAWIPLLI